MSSHRRLLIRPGAIGDFILSLPALESLAADYTEVWVESPQAPLVRFADRVRPISETGLNWLEIPDREPPAALTRSLGGFDSVITWYGSQRAAFREALQALAPHAVFFPALPPDGSLHAADYYMEQAATVTGRVLRAVPRLRCTHAPHGCAVIHPFSGSRWKNWPLERFQQVAAWLETRMEVAWCAGPEEELVGARRFDDLYSLACWLAGARLYVGNDSGITHLAAAAGAPVVALFGPTDPAVWAPRGQRVEVVSAGSPGSAIVELQPEPVLAAVASVLRSST